MLMMLGPVAFTVAPFNAHQSAHTHETDYAEKPILGARPGLEFVGEGPERWTIEGRLFPEKFGGLSQLELLAQARRSGQPQYMMRGDGGQMGWVSILSISETSSHLDARGVGRVVDVSISVQRAEAPGAGNYFSLMSQVLLWAS